LGQARQTAPLSAFPETIMNKILFASTPSCHPLPIRSSQEYFELYPRVIANLPHEAIGQAITELLRAYEEGRNVFIFGNGGSAALASHFACDLGKGTLIGNNGGKRFRVMALTDNLPLISAWANDTSYENIFAEQLKNFVGPGDIAFAISGSGSSPNVLQALKAAKQAQATTIGLTGFKGGKMKSLCDFCVILSSDNMQVIEDFHLSVTHAIFSVLRQRISESILARPLTAGVSAD
jgi:D-sedoheptulose 7-phosphate isomerase